jgi:hypothetical protein
MAIQRRAISLYVRALPVPHIFGLAFTAGGEVLRVCSLSWSRGKLIGARFVTATKLRQGFAASAGADHNVPLA